MNWAAAARSPLHSNLRSPDCRHTGQPLSSRRPAGFSAGFAGILVLLLGLFPGSSSAIELRWSSGASDLTFTSAIRCTLVVQAEVPEHTLPPAWRLIWVASGCSIQPLAIDPLAGCLATTAQVAAVIPPATPADSAAHVTTALFCSAPTSTASAAFFLLDFPAGASGKLKVAALDTTGLAPRAIESPEVTFNGGVPDPYPPVILSASRSHPSTRLLVEAVGIGLAAASRVEIAAHDSSWRIPLSIMAQTATGLTAVAQVAADLPACLFRVITENGAMDAMPLPADTASVLSVQPACTSAMKEINLISGENIQPKDFSIATSRDSFHIFYTRQDYNLSSTPAADSKIIGHKRSRNLNDWFPPEGTMSAIKVRPGRFDNGHVWAPSIVRKPGNPTYFMFYTGVNTAGVQRIGVATSFDLNVWTPDTTEIYQSSNVGWALANTPQFRDAFVMADPDSAGRYLMYFVTVTQARRRYVVGVARTDRNDPANLRTWKNPLPLWNTDFVHTGANIVESPHAFVDPGNRWWLLYSGYNSGATQDSAFVSFETNDFSPAITDTLLWSVPDTLYKHLGGDQKLQFWHASEYLRAAPGYEYLLAFNDSEHSIDIAQVSWRGPHTFVLTDSCPPRVPALDVNPNNGDQGLVLRPLGPIPARGALRFRIDVPSRMRVHLAVFDIGGRRMRTLLDEELSPGGREVRWDGRSALGDAARGGVYFARLTTAGGQRVARVVLLR